MNIIKKLGLFIIIGLSLSVNADFYLDNEFENDTEYAAEIALIESYAKPMKFIDVELKGKKFGVEAVYKVNFKTPFLGKHHHFHFSLEKKKNVRVLQNSKSYSTLWPPGHFLGQ